MSDYPAAITATNHVAPVPRRIRAFAGGQKVIDTTRALYVWEWPNYPQYYIPLADVRSDLLEPEGHTQQTGRGVVELRALRAGPVHRPRAAKVLADAGSSVMVFETGLPTRYYLSRTDIDFGPLIPTDTVTSCPYKGTTSGYWSVRAGGTVHQNLGWSYDFPTRDLLPIAGMIAFYNEKADIVLDGQRLERPETHFFAARGA
jgi:uncharacterized protein (DUF427 family)